MNRFPVSFALAMLLSICSNSAMADEPKEYVPQGDYQIQFCDKFSLIEWQFIVSTLKEMEATPYPIDSYFQTAACQPRGYGDDVKSPIVHVVADNTSKREKFLNMMWLYYTKKRNDPAKFTEVLNVTNTRGETLLDYLESQQVRDKYNEELQESADKIIAFACSHGAKYSTYPNKRCP